MAPKPILEHFPNASSIENGTGGGRWLPSQFWSNFLIQIQQEMGDSSEGGRWLPSFSSSLFPIQIQKGILLENARLL